MSNSLHRKYGLFTAICLVVGIVIGSGIFYKAQTVLQRTGGDMPVGILSWAIGGAIMLVCLLTFSFMGQKYERCNGVVDYSEATVNSRYGYYMGWFLTTVYYPSMTSVLAWVSSRYTLEFLVSVGLPLSPGSNPSTGPECMALTVFFLCAAYAMNALSPKLAGKFQTSTTVIKLIPLGLMIITGITYGLFKGTLTQNFTTNAVVVEGISTNPLFAGVCASAFAYEGWIIATAINAELKDSKRNLPKALTIGGIIIASVYVLYYIGVAGGASNQELIDQGAHIAFTNIFGNLLGNILKLFIAVSCLGTLNGLMLGCCRGMYSVAVRKEGPAPQMYAQVDAQTNMPNNSCVFALLITAVWFLYFYVTNLYLPSVRITDKPFMFDSSELPIITIYLMYLPIFFQWMRKEKDQNIARRFILPLLASAGSIFMVIACIFSHGVGCFWYLLVFIGVMFAGYLLDRRNHKKTEK